MGKWRAILVLSVLAIGGCSGGGLVTTPTNPNTPAVEEAVANVVLDTNMSAGFAEISASRHWAAVATEVQGKSLQEALVKRGVNPASVEIQVVGRIDPANTIRDNIDPVAGGLQIGMSYLSVFNLDNCTLGFNAIRNGVRGFVTASHCSQEWGRVDGQIFHQPRKLLPADRIGEEVADREFRPQDCSKPSGEIVICRWSDSLFASYDANVDAPVGLIAKSDRSLNLLGYLNIVGTAEVSEGATIHKVGRTTGRTEGKVVLTNFNWIPKSEFPLKPPVHIFRNQILVTGEPPSDLGDSGGPAFTPPDANGNVRLVGLVVGGCGSSQPPCNFSVLSPFRQIERDLGTLTVVPATPPSPPPPPSTEYHYNVWRGGNEAINKGVAWAAESFTAQFNTISQISFNAGGPSGGPWANSATVFIYSNEAMTNQVAAVFVPDISDYGETIAQFPSPVSLSVGQIYWLQVHTGQADVRVLLYASIFGNDYPSGCAYWHDFNASTVRDCAVDLNLKIRR